jgi:hypothetical protein
MKMRLSCFITGEKDCLDWSDEHTIYSEHCPYASANMECEDHICLRRGLSCGDGQCVAGHAQLNYYKERRYYCHSMREFNYMCEVYLKKQLWTQPNGLCWDLPGYDDPLDMNNKDLDDRSKCIYLIRCALSKGFERDCPCDHRNCSLVMAGVCEKDELYEYPNRPLFRPYIITSYKWNQSWDNYEPSMFSLRGSIKCRGYHGKIENSTEITSFHSKSYDSFPLVDYLFCNHRDVKRDNESVVRYDKLCWNDSFTLNKRPYAFFDLCSGSNECISQYRVNDDLFDCGVKEKIQLKDKNLCSNVQKHRFQCSTEQPSCFPATSLGDSWEDCENGRDEFINGLGESIDGIQCTQRNDDGCRFLIKYIGDGLPANLTDNVADNISEAMIIPFRSYCDTFWNLQSHSDESPHHCRIWTCQRDQYQCQTGQCIDVNWLCDGEWDCLDASDEQAVFLNLQGLPHNQQLQDFENRTQECNERYAEQPLSGQCNVNTEFPCFLANVTNPLDIEKNRPCINLTQIGDRKANCYGGLDEKNTFEDCSGAMLGFTLRCGDERCLAYASACKEELQRCDDQVLCHYKSKNESCSGVNDVLCLNGSCRKNARCNGTFECPFGEDEYWCPLGNQAANTKFKYRNNKRTSAKFSQDLLWSIYPMPSTSKSTERSQEETARRPRSLSTGTDNVRTSTNYSDSFLCNRGVAIKSYPGNITCLCPPPYYGASCQYYSDRVSIITHLDLASLPSSYFRNNSNWFKIMASLLHAEHVIDFHEFDVNGEIETEDFVKHKFYLLYSLSNETKTFKRFRHFNRTDIIENRSYSVRFVIYELNIDEVKELGSWIYPIYFDFLPVYRLATVLKFPAWYGNSTFDPCANNASCAQNSTCLPIFNQNKSNFWCAYKNNFFESKCLSYCSPNALCKPEDRGKLTNTNNPLCICPLHRFGPRCNLRHEECRSQPCFNNGTCHLRHDPSGRRSFVCNCSNNFHGDRCQYEKFAIRIDLNMSSQALASVVQFYSIHRFELKLLIQHQQVVKGPPASVRYSHTGSVPPVLSVLKLYYSTESEYFILYIQPNTTMINITSTPQYCPPAASFPLVQSKFGLFVDFSVRDIQ